MGADFLKALQQGIAPPLRDRTKALYASMDDAYASVSTGYGFTCEGCTDNCCTSIFHHHTLAECLYLLDAVKEADAGHRADIFARAREVVASYSGGKALICPINVEGLCTLYAPRPMICRLHGLPHKFSRPDGASLESGGCRRFDSLYKTDIRLDRTPFYTELAAIEKELRARLNFTGRVKLTTAELLLSIETLCPAG